MTRIVVGKWDLVREKGAEDEGHARKKKDFDCGLWRREEVNAAAVTCNVFILLLSF
jgi:hypothetical protein